MVKSLAAKIAELSPEAQRRVCERTATLVSQELTLRDRRTATAKAQVEDAPKACAKLTLR